MKQDKLTMTLLFDLYGDLLTAKQHDCFDLHYNQDYTLAEIAELEGISRQGVHDAITRAEAQLMRIEQVTGTLALQRRSAHAAQRLRQLAQALPGAPAEELPALARQLDDCARALE